MLGLEVCIPITPDHLHILGEIFIQVVCLFLTGFFCENILSHNQVFTNIFSCYFLSVKLLWDLQSPHPDILDSATGVYQYS